MNFIEDSEASDDDLLLDVNYTDINQILVLSTAYIEVLRGTLERPPLRSILVTPFKSSEIVEQLVQGHPDACHDALGMSPRGLQRICSDLERNGTVKPSPTVELRAKVAMTLWMLRRSASNRATREFWQFSQASVSKYVPQTLTALVSG